MTPQLLVVSGLPASGKTYLGTRLAAALAWPLVTKDDYKEILHDHLPNLTRAEAGPLSFALMWHTAGTILAAGQNVVMETHFYRPVSETHLLELQQNYAANLAQIFCHAPLPELERRHAARVALGEHPHIHQPFAHADLPPAACWEPLNLNAPLLHLDTTQTDAEASALAWVQGIFASHTAL